MYMCKCVCYLAIKPNELKRKENEMKEHQQKASVKLNIAVAI